MTRARFGFREDLSDDSRLVIVDLGPWDRYPTVTNDAEAVVAELVGSGQLAGRRLFYFDSEGEPGEIVLLNGRFWAFRPAEELR